jgi:uncharacterized protein
LTFLALAATGLIAGILGALLGIGGGIFLVPALTILFDLPIRVAVGTSLVAVIATSAGVGAVAPRGRGGNISLALRLSLTTTAGAIAGSWLAGHITGSVLSIIFAVAVFGTAAYTLYKTLSQPKTQGEEKLYTANYTPTNWGLGMGLTTVAGMFSGMLGVGGGFMNVPLMYSLMDIPLGVATATSNFMVGITAAASVFVYYSRGDLRPLVIVPTAFGVFIGAMVGVFVLRRLSVAWVRGALIGLLILMGIQMLLKGIQG